MSALAVGVLGIADARSPADALAGYEEEVERAYKAREITADELTRMVAAGKDEVLLLDAREASEFNVSRIPGAIRIDPNASAEKVLNELGGAISGRRVVIYCSVGVRSSIAQNRLEKPLSAHGAVSVAHLRGGIFRWHNERRVLADAAGTVDVVHPYNAFWKRYLKFGDKARYTALPR